MDKIERARKWDEGLQGTTGKTEVMVVKGGRTGRKLHLALSGSSCLLCGHWTGYRVEAFRVRQTVEQTVVQTAPKNLCEKCFSWALEPEGGAR